MKLREQQEHSVFMKRAITLAVEASEKGNEPFGAILVKDNSIVKEANNQIHSHSDPTNHAELSLIRDFCTEAKVTDLSEYSLYTSCEPCCMCSGAMVWANLGHLYYSVSHDELADIAGSNIMIGCQEVFDRSPHQPTVHPSLCQTEGLKVVKEYAWT